MTFVARLERTIDADPLGEALDAVAVPVSSALRAAVRSRAHTRLAHRRRRRILIRTAAGAAVLSFLGFTPPGHGVARLVLPAGLQQRFGLVEGAPRTLTPPGGARARAVPSHLLSPIPCSAVPTPGPGRGGGVACYPDLSIAEAQATVDFHIEIPAVLPSGLHYRGALTTGRHDAYLSWVRNDGHPGALSLGIKDGAALPGGSAVPSGTLQPVTVNGSPGYVVRGDYEDNGPGTAAHWNPHADDYELTWAHDRLTYDLTAGDLHLSVADLVRIAESVS